MSPRNFTSKFTARFVARGKTCVRCRKGQATYRSEYCVTCRLAIAEAEARVRQVKQEPPA